jgi:hypothetical protein
MRDEKNHPGHPSSLMSLIPSPLEFAPVKRLGAVCLLLLVACGKRGDPHPPIPVIPQTTSDLVVTQRGARVILSWAYPSLSTAGRNLGAVRRVVVYRYLEPLPATAPGRDPNALLPGDIDTTLPGPVALFAKVPPMTPAQFNKLKDRLDSIEGASLGPATVGARLAYEDAPPFHSQDGRPIRATYAVVTETQTAKGDLSNLVAIVPIDVPLPPANVVATPKPEGVVLTWQRPGKSATGADKPFVSGYDIFRSGPSDQAEELPVPINSAPVRDATYTDVPPYGDYQYRVAAVSSAGPPRVSSEPSTGVTTTFKDLVPPPAPANVVALIETNAVRLIWDPSDAPDLRGYYVYRVEGTARTRITKEAVAQPNYRDASVKAGVLYGYQVTAVDKNGNESGGSASPAISIPRTP